MQILAVPSIADPDPYAFCHLDPLVTGTDPDPYIIKQKK